MNYSDYEKFAQAELKKGKKREEVIDYLVDMDCKRLIAEEITNRMLVEQTFSMKHAKRRVVRVEENEMEMD
ncbi:MAG: hypothetical protein IJA40_05640 [Phascolarctobacterium sp.]|nr:hypothetical protein [Phascolarctobacterium sp.]